MSKPHLIVIVGPTASGKTDLSIKLAKQLNGEIINADSRQIYKEVNIGTAKPSQCPSGDCPFVDCPLSKNDASHAMAKRKPDFISNGIIHYGINIISLKEDYNAGRFVDLFNEKLKLILKKGKQPILTGGTGLYINAALYGLSKIPETPKNIKEKARKLALDLDLKDLYNLLKKVDPNTKVDPNNPRRITRALEVFYSTNIPITEWHKKESAPKPNLDFKIYGLSWDRDELYKRINKRVDLMLEEGLINEVKNLLVENFTPQEIEKAGIGYNHILNHLNKKLTLKETTDLIKRDTRRYAKRQLTWFKKNKEITWLKTSRKDLANRILS